MTTLHLRKLIRPPLHVGFLLVTLLLICFALPQMAQAFLPPPPPDGGYPGFNTAEGQNALFSLTTGEGNTAAGWFSLYSETTGNFNTATGAGALALNNGDHNTATGAATLLRNTTGFYNTADGAFALYSNTEGSGNTGSGYQALYSNQTGANNAAFGYTSLYHNTADFNTAFGSQTLVYNTNGSKNTATGYQALVFNTTGAYNTASGYQALYSNTIGNENTASGDGALHSNQSGGYNTALGEGALYNNTAGTSNTAIGWAAGLDTTGNDNILINNFGLAGENNTIRIGSGVHTVIYIAGIAGQTVGAGGTTCYVDNNGKLGVFLSARRFKTDIADMDNASEALLALRPVTFHYKPELDKTGIPQFGLIAEEVAKVNPDLVTHDAKGELSTVRYEAVNVMLLNEFLKEHREVQELKKQVAALTAGLQKVSARLEASKPAPQLVNNP